MEARDLSKLFKTAEELIEPEESIITGEIPEWLRGSFIRVGPGKWDLGNFTMNHLLDGYALLTKFEITGQRVQFTKRYLESDAYLKGTLAQKPLITEFGTKAYPNPNNKKIFSRLISSLAPPEMTDNATCSFFHLSSQDLFVTSNTTYFRKVDPSNLSTGDKYDYSKWLGLNGVGVHPLRDEAGNLYNIGFTVITGPRYQIVKIPGNYEKSEDMLKHATTIASISSRWKTNVGFFHSFGMTTNFIIFIEIPYWISLTKAAKSLIKGDSYKDWMEWRPEEPTKFFVIEKRTGKVRKIDYIAPSFFFLHFVNCYEIGSDQIVIDINVYKSPAMIDSLYLKQLRSNIFEEVDPPSIQRFVLPLINSDFASLPEGTNLLTHSTSSATAVKTGHRIVLSPEIFPTSGLQLPTINPAYQGKENRFHYSAGSFCENHFMNTISKVNMEGKEITIWRGKGTVYPGEPLFIPKFHSAQTEDEDEGVILSACSNADQGSVNDGESNDFLLFLDPKNMKELGRAKFRATIPPAMHGIFLRA